MIYVIVFFISIYFMWKAECAIDLNKKYKSYILFAVFLPIFIASVRAKEVGVDMLAYVIPWYNSVSKFNSFLKFCEYCVDSKEYLYYALIYFPSRIFGSLFPSLFIQQMLIMFGVVSALLYFKRAYKIQLTYAYALYLFFYYNESLCIMRQSIAVSFGLLALTILLEDKVRKFIFISFVTFFFHNSILAFSIICLGFYLINKNVHKKRLKVISYSLILIAMSSLSFITDIIVNLNVNERFVERLVEGDQNQGGYLTIALYAVFVFIPFILKFVMRKRIYIDYIWIFPIVGFIFVVLAKQSMYFGRMSYPFLCCLIITLAHSLRNQTILKYVILLLVISYWYYDNVISDTWGTYNYIMDTNCNL